ncbi:MAG: glucose-1-phosphate thymidylyltransferase [Thermoplasmatales archaeon]
MKGIILHGGSGTRLRPLTYTDVKQLLPIAGKPVSEYALESLIELGISDINIIVGEVGEKEVRQYYSDGSKWNVKISYTYQGAPKGIAQAIGMTEDFVGEDNFVVVLGDNYFQNGLTPAKEVFSHTKADALVLLTVVDNPSQFGIATVENGRIVKIVEKPKKTSSNLAVTGAYFLRKSIFDIIRQLKPSWRDELEITEAFQIMLDKGMKIEYSIIDGWWKDTGTVDEFLDCNRMVLDRIKRDVPTYISDSVVTGRVRMGSNVIIEGETKILGPCYIGKNSRINNCYIGPFSSIGSDCIIENTEIEDSVIMDGTSVQTSEGLRVTRSIIGPNTKITPSRSKSRTLRLVVGRDSLIEL